MAEEKPSIQVDSDWKRQAQEEKKRLAEEAEKRKAAAPAGQGAAPRAGGPGREERQLPPASFASLVQSIVTQALLYMGDLAARGSEPMVDLDMAKRSIDTLAILEEKTKGNLSDEEKRLLDAALYDVRMRFVSVASQVASYP